MAKKARFIDNPGVSAFGVTNALTATSASFATTSVSASFATTASHALFAVSASVEITKEISSSHANVADVADGLQNQPSISVTNVTASSDISASGTITGLSGSFSELSGNSPLTVNGTVDFMDTVNISGSINVGGNSVVTSNQTGSFITGNQTGSYATTGSNNFIGNQTITGSLTVSGSGTLTNIGPFNQTGNSTFNGNSSQPAIIISGSQETDFGSNSPTDKLRIGGNPGESFIFKYNTSVTGFGFIPPLLQISGSGGSGSFNPNIILGNATIVAPIKGDNVIVPFSFYVGSRFTAPDVQSNTKGAYQFLVSGSDGNAGGGVISLGKHGIDPSGSSDIFLNGHVQAAGNITASGDISSSAVSTASFGTYLGDGSQLSGISGGSSFPFSGSAVITGSLFISGSQPGSGGEIERVRLDRFHIKTQKSFDAGFLGSFGSELIISSSDHDFKNPLFVIDRDSIGDGSKGVDLWVKKDLFVGGANFVNGKISTIFSVTGSNAAQGTGGFINLGNPDKSLALNPSINLIGHLTASAGVHISASATSTASFGTYIGDGSQLSGISAGSSIDTGSLGNTTITGSLTVSGSGTLTNIGPFNQTGDAQITGSLTISGSFIPLGNAADDTNVIIGKNAATNITSTSGNNVVIGNEAGGSGGTFSNADGNVCIGYQAGNGVDGGDNNICIGYQAGYLLDSESETIAMGYQTLRNVGNSYSVGIGSQAGRFQTNGPNTLLGGFAGYGVSGNSLARYNTILGYKSGYVLEEGYYNIIVGGNDVGLSVKDGYHNVIIGGEDTGYNLTDGTGNIILGSQAGKSIVTGNYNIIIGHSSSLSSDTSNQLFIGSGSVATISASLTTGDILLQGDVSSSATSTASFGTYIGDGSQLSGISGGSGFPFAGDAVITGSLVVSSSNSTASLTLEGSGSTVFNVIGSAGRTK